MRFVLLGAVAAVIALQGCSAARSTIHEGQHVSRAKPLPKDEQLKEDQPILMIKGNLPPNVKVEVIGEVNANSGRYSSMDRMYKELAIRARRVGADAVVNVNVKYRVTGFAWAAPTVAGVAVKVVDDGGVDIKKLDGQWR